ncbi:MAG: translation elongation factor Ts [Flavobacteriales bacterium]|jgi:elongation factor Ts|nr:translation elongation factor Ts [Flavobacteriales bacterium]
MAKITAAEVNKLRKQTGAGMMDCKKALVEAEGDFEQAIDILRKKGQKVAAKRADRETMEGAVLAGTTEDNSKGFVISLNCETDFVAKNDSYVALAKSILDVAIANDPKSSEELLAMNINGMTIADKLIEQTGVIGEKLEVKFFERIEAGFVGSYIHAGNKIATIVGLNKSVDNAAELAKDVAMQAAAMNPVALNKDGVDQATIDRELEVGKDLARQEGKPEAMLDKIAMGRLNKFFKENTLVAQAFIKDSKVTVEQYLKSADKELVAVDFKRCSLV